ncbi:MAG TPA: hypothetical protein VFK06_11125 [Candidatus Angelobacter sp.]|nr:hypothetical protein [Candidatus Angelobacter sp.]
MKAYIKTVLLIVLIAADLGIAKASFYEMNSASDIGFICGIFGLVTALFITVFSVKKLFAKTKEKD